jgi:hypothetical protein
MTKEEGLRIVNDVIEHCRVHLYTEISKEDVLAYVESQLKNHAMRHIADKIPFQPGSLATIREALNDRGEKKGLGDAEELPAEVKTEGKPVIASRRVSRKGKGKV